MKEALDRIVEATVHHLMVESESDARWESGERVADLSTFARIPWLSWAGCTATAQWGRHRRRRKVQGYWKARKQEGKS